MGSSVEGVLTLCSDDFALLNIYIRTEKALRLTLDNLITVYSDVSSGSTLYATHPAIFRLYIG